MYICNAIKILKIMETQTQNLLEFISKHNSTMTLSGGEISTKFKEVLNNLSPMVLFGRVVFHNIQKLSIPGILEYLFESLPNMDLDYTDIQSIHCFEIFEEEEFPTLMIQIKVYFSGLITEKEIETQISKLRSDNNEDIKYYNNEDIREYYPNESLDLRYVTRMAHFITIISRP